MPVVVDASIAIAWSLPEARTPRARRVRERLVADGGIVPALWAAEVANAFLVAERRGRLTAEATGELLDGLFALPIVTDAPRSGFPFAKVLTLARDQSLTAYDATYLELAIRERVELATLDAQLARAARSLGLLVEESGPPR